MQIPTSQVDFYGRFLLIAAKGIVPFIRLEGTVAVIQLGHAGRKASERRPWNGETHIDDTHIAEGDDPPWPTLGMSAIPYAEGWHIPEEMTRADIGVKYALGMPQRELLTFYEVLSYAAQGFCSISSIFRSPIFNEMITAAVLKIAYGFVLKWRILFVWSGPKSARSSFEFPRRTGSMGDGRSKSQSNLRDF